MSHNATERVELMAKLAQELQQADAVFEAEQQHEADVLHAMTVARDATLKDLDG